MGKTRRVPFDKRTPKVQKPREHEEQCAVCHLMTPVSDLNRFNECLGCEVEAANGSDS